MLAVFDMSRPCDAEDAALLGKLPRERTICVCNKGDLTRKWDGELDGFAETVEISAKTAENMDALEKAVSAFAARRAVPAEDGLIANERQRTCLTAAADAVQEGLNALQMGLAYDAVTVSLDDAAAALLELTGERVTDRVVDTVFSRFCVGK